MTARNIDSPAERVSTILNHAMFGIFIARTSEEVDSSLRHVEGIIKGAHAAGVFSDEEAFEHDEHARRHADKRRTRIWERRNANSFARS